MGGSPLAHGIICRDKPLANGILHAPMAVTVYFKFGFSNNLNSTDNTVRSIYLALRVLTINRVIPLKYQLEKWPI